MWRHWRWLSLCVVLSTGVLAAVGGGLSINKASDGGWPENASVLDQTPPALDRPIPLPGEDQTFYGVRLGDSEVAASPLQGGEDIAHAVALPTLPATVSGTTLGYLNNYDEICPYSGSTAPDVVYSYQAPADQTVDLSLCTSEFDTKIYIYADSYTPGSPIACNDNSCPGYKSYLWNVELTGGHTYYIIIDGYGTAAGNYELYMHVAESCTVPCPPGATLEGEPTGCDYPDVTNGGCNSDPDVFSLTGCQQTICGTSGSFMYGGSGYRDTDWYELRLTVARHISWSVTAEFPVLSGLILTDPAGSGDCAGVQGVLPWMWLEACEPGELEMDLEPGTWWFFVAPSQGLGTLVSCDARYVATLDCGCDDADNDLVCDDIDNCPGVANTDQVDGDDDGLGNACDPVTIAFSADVTLGPPPLTVSFTDESTGLSPLTSWHWDFGDESTSEERHPVHTYTYKSAFAVTLIVSDGVTSDTASMDIVTGDLDFENVEHSVLATPFHMKVADLDLDNSLDLVIGSLLGVNGVEVVFGDGNGSFGDDPYLYYNGTNNTVAIGFVNADSLPDFVSRREGSEFNVFLNDGARGFVVSSVPVPAATGVQALAMGYFDSDAYVDVVTSPNHIIYGNGDGTFARLYTLPTVYFRAANVGDFNKDGHDDLVTAGFDGTIRILTNLGDGTFHETASLTTVGFATAVATNSGLADFDADGNPDFSTVGQGSSDDESIIYVVFGDGSGGISRTVTRTVPGFAYNIVICDADRDQYLDVATTTWNPGQYTSDLIVFLNNRAGSLGGAMMFPWSSVFALALETGDFDRDGNPDFITGSMVEGLYLEIAINLMADRPIIDDEMTAVGYGDVAIEVINPLGFTISRDVRTVAGSDYLRFDSDGDGTVDQESLDYNVEYGEYSVTGKLLPTAGPGDTWTMGIGINGSQMAICALNYNWPGGSKAALDGAADSLVFYYTVEETSSIQPPFGIPITDRSPLFDWSGRVGGNPPGTRYQFQLHRYHDFSFPPYIFDISSLANPSLQLPSSLPADSVYYWRYVTSSDGGATYTDTSRSFALYIVSTPGCCVDRVGDANNSGDDEPTIGDVSALIDALFISGTFEGVIFCLAEADVNQSGGSDPTTDDVTIGDISLLIDYLFISGAYDPVSNPDGTQLSECL